MQVEHVACRLVPHQLQSAGLPEGHPLCCCPVQLYQAQTRSSAKLLMWRRRSLAASRQRPPLPGSAIAPGTAAPPRWAAQHATLQSHSDACKFTCAHLESWKTKQRCTMTCMAHLQVLLQQAEELQRLPDLLSVASIRDNHLTGLCARSDHGGRLCCQRLHAPTCCHEARTPVTLSVSSNSAWMIHI